ncbi:hypothetical protein AB6A40_008293 [Gnathostoma spinigerum]|uniref:Uncharacterized protein n=1 Tax=Gnathostoma spinigerum TaxID=75299 RepID=A0ABD6ENM9_9BILA
MFGNWNSPERYNQFLEKEIFLKGLNVSNSARNELLVELRYMKKNVENNEAERNLYLNPIGKHVVLNILSAPKDERFFQQRITTNQAD